MLAAMAPDAAAVHDALTLAASAIDARADIDKGWRIVTAPSEPGVHKVEVVCVSGDDWERLTKGAKGYEPKSRGTVIKRG